MFSSRIFFIAVAMLAVSAIMFNGASSPAEKAGEKITARAAMIEKMTE